MRAHSTPQTLAFRCQLILRMSPRQTDHPICVATEMACERHTVGRWRQYLAHGFNEMHRARVARSAFPPLSASVLAMATKKPATYYCPATVES